LARAAWPELESRALSLGFLLRKNSERRKNGMDAVALGRQDAGWFQFLEFLRSENP
jgi:hypothetical protein